MSKSVGFLLLLGFLSFQVHGSTHGVAHLDSSKNQCISCEIHSTAVVIEPGEDISQLILSAPEPAPYTNIEAEIKDHPYLDLYSPRPPPVFVI